LLRRINLCMIQTAKINYKEEIDVYRRNFKYYIVI
jgi:hypothetical protein